MTRRSNEDPFDLTRRQALKSLGVGALGTLPMTISGAGSSGTSFYVKQGGQEIPLEPLSYEDYTVEEFYNLNQGVVNTLTGIEEEKTSAASALNC